MDEMITHKCYVCKKTHEEEAYRWHEKKIGKRKVFYCHHGIDCTGCQKLHYNDTGGERSSSAGRFCRKWYGSQPPTLKQKLANMSSEEVVSGGLHGMPNQFKTVSEDYTPEVRKQQHEMVKEALR